MCFLCVLKYVQRMADMLKDWKNYKNKLNVNWKPNWDVDQEESQNKSSELTG